MAAQTQAEQIEELMKSNKNQQESIRKLIDMNNYLQDCLEEKNSQDQKQVADASLANYKDASSADYKDAISQIYKSSYKGKYMEFKNGTHCYELIFKMGIKLYETFCIELSYAISKFQLKTSKIIWEKSNKDIYTHDYTSWPTKEHLDPEYAEVYRSKHFVSINCDQVDYDKIIKAGLFDATKLVLRKKCNA
jgi:hypothetical protein